MSVGGRLGRRERLTLWMDEQKGERTGKLGEWVSGWLGGWVSGRGTELTCLAGQEDEHQ